MRDTPLGGARPPPCRAWLRAGSPPLLTRPSARTPCPTAV